MKMEIQFYKMYFTISRHIINRLGEAKKIFTASVQRKKHDLQAKCCIKFVNP